MLKIRPRLLVVFALAATACGAQTPRGDISRSAAAVADGAPRPPLAWASLDRETFARARAEKRLIVVDGSAEWCHWCHVMEATTYHDPGVRELLDSRFVAVKVDVDEDPDFEERYHEWGWPATVLFSPEGAEIGKYKGYLPPARFLEILRAAASKADAAAESTAEPAVGIRVPSEDDVAALQARTEQQLEAFWDPQQGGWGREQKVPLHCDNEWALARARAGDSSSKQRVLFALDQQAKIVDPVWGGICQYSTDGDWGHPHYEKLASFQAGAIEDYASAYALTHDDFWLRDAQLVRKFVDRFLTDRDGGHYATMDADLNAHDSAHPFLTGHDYYAKSDADRIALGIPRVDTQEYGRDNGLLIAAYATLFEATGDRSALAAARRSADRILSTHTAPAGGITHEALRSGQSDTVVYLADNAAVGFALARLYEVTHDSAYLDSARSIAQFMVHGLLDASAGGGFFSSTPDPRALGALAERRKPFEENVLAIRFLAKLARLVPTDEYRTVIGKTIAVVGTPGSVASRGRMVGDLLLALDETRGLR